MILNVDELAAIIRYVDGNHSLGAGQLAEAILDEIKVRVPPVNQDRDDNRAIYKYPIEITDSQVIELQTEYPAIDILHIAMQGDVLTMWVEVDLDVPAQPVPIFVVGTGHKLPVDAQMHLATVQDPHGFVWHIYTLAPEHNHGDDEDIDSDN